MHMIENSLNNYQYCAAKCCLSLNLKVNKELEELIVFGMELHNLTPM